MSDILNLIAEARRAAFEHRFVDAAAHASTALERTPTCLLALRILAWAQLELDDDAALATFEQCAEFDPDDALAHVGHAIGHEQHGETDAAVLQWLRAWVLDAHTQAMRRALVKRTGAQPHTSSAAGVSPHRGQR